MRGRSSGDIKACRRTAVVRTVVGVAGIEPAASCSQSRRAPSAPHPVDSAHPNYRLAATGGQDAPGRAKRNAPRLGGTSAQRCDLWGGVTIIPQPTGLSTPIPGIWPMQRVIMYVDGFNLFYGLRAKGWRRYYWLDLRRLAENLLRPGQQLEAVRYFTARIEADPRDPGNQRRQNAYLEALATIPDIHIHYGYFQSKSQQCYRCGTTWQTYEEKMTDVNIAVELLRDAQDDAFDTAILMSGDGDLAGPLLAVRERYPAKSVVVAFPPKRRSIAMTDAATTYFTVGRGRLHNSQLPPIVVREDGFGLTRPTTWT